MAKRGRGRPIVETLSAPQRRLLEVIEARIEQHGMSPTFRELADDLGQGVPSIYKLIQRLERNGYISRTTGKSRSLTVVRSAHESEPVGLVSIPLLGTVAAGNPLFAPENQLGELLVEAATVRSGRHFALKVTGQSMIKAGIHSGDVLIVRQQPLAEHRDIVVALLNDEATVKRLHHRQGEIQLLPENDRYKPIPIGPEDDLRIVGKVVAVKRMA
ncbi:transcriptional repressor LexA [Schlesneria paludicola]|uniref:transcriptional repressor LexA n=1 Tax=Schlesneria paludicola TaxID=360056 RepID=UPI00029A8B72|nr:transcriptional repressor LexA [Schlesneria paludicola]